MALLHPLVRRPADEGPDQRALLHRVADGEPAVGGDQAVGELVDHTAVCDDPAHGRASLACRAGRGEHHPTRRQVEVCGRAHDGGVVPAELEQGAAEAIRDARSDCPTHAGRAGRAEQGDAGVVHECRPDVGSTDEHLAEVGGRVAVGDGLGQDARDWRVLSAGASSEGFQMTGSPQTSATAVFQDHTAAGKLNALMTPTTPSGCQVSISR